MLASEVLYLCGIGTAGAASCTYLWRASTSSRAVSALTDAGGVTVSFSEDRDVDSTPLGQAFARLTWLLLGAAIVARVLEARRPPYANLWEYFLVLAFATLTVYLLAEWRLGQRTVGALVLPLVAGELLLGEVMFSSAVEPLVPALQNNRLLAIHVACMILAYGALGTGFAASVAYLARQGGAAWPWLPARELAWEIQDRAIMAGFLVLGLGIVLGAYWGNIAWGRYWGWDPKETTALVSWLIYAAYMHTRNLRGWKGSPSAWLSVAGFSAIVFNILVVNFVISGLHSYASP